MLTICGKGKNRYSNDSLHQLIIKSLLRPGLELSGRAVTFAGKGDRGTLLIRFNSGGWPDIDPAALWCLWRQDLNARELNKTQIHT